MSNSHPRQANQHYVTLPRNRWDRLDVHSRKSAWEWNRIPAFLSRRGTIPLRFVYALRLASRSFVGHIRELLAREHRGVLLGPWYETLPNGCLVRNRRTDARSVGIQELTSRYPEANTIELEMFLEGFDKGERFALGRQDKLAQVVCESSVASHFQNCPHNQKRHLTIDMLKRQWYKSQYESPRHRNPSQSD
jgi:hypothetical protein